MTPAQIKNFEMMRKTGMIPGGMGMPPGGMGMPPGGMGMPPMGMPGMPPMGMPGMPPFGMPPVRYALHVIVIVTLIRRLCRECLQG
jgi:hypothetical protein